MNQKRPRQIMLALCLALWASSNSLANSPPAEAGACAAIARFNVGEITPESPEVTAALSDHQSGRSSLEQACAGVLLGARASYRNVHGQMSDALRDAEQSLTLLTPLRASSDLLLLKPLYVVAHTNVALGRMTAARQAYQRLLLIRSDRPSDLRLVHAMKAILANSEHNLREAASEYGEFIRLAEDAGIAYTAEMAAARVTLAFVYEQDGQMEKARRQLDHAETILNSATDVIPFDRMLFQLCRGVLASLTGHWSAAELCFSETLSLIDLNPSPAGNDLLTKLLPHYAVALRKLHKRDEARLIEARSAGLARDLQSELVVDITDLSEEGKRKKKSYKP